MRKGDILLKILGTIAAAPALTAIGLFEALTAILNSGYGASYGKMEYEMSKQRFFTSDKDIKQKYYKIIYKLKKSGLIEEKGISDKKVIHLTTLGRDKLVILKGKQKNNLPEIKSFKKERGDKYIIVIFDIPEKEKRKRAWLRNVLRNIGMEMKQKSVWIGKVKIPKKLLDNLYEYKLIDFVEIFEITKLGSLKNRF